MSHLDADGLRQILESVEGVRGDVVALGVRVADMEVRIGGEVRQLREAEIARTAAAAARGAHAKRRETLPSEVDELRRQLEARPTTAIWASPEGRQVIWWVIGGAVLVSLAVNGGLTFADLRGTVSPVSAMPGPGAPSAPE